MFKIGEFVINSNNGICEITDVVTMDVSGSKKEYYQLVPITEQTAKVFVPLALAEQKIRPAMSRDDASSLISNIKNIDMVYLENEKEREQIYKQALQSREPERLVSIIKTLYLRKQQRLESGKKNTAVDERYFKLAELQLYGELSFALKLSREEIISLIVQALK